MEVYFILAGVFALCALAESGQRTKKDLKLFSLCLFLFLIVVGCRYYQGDYPSYEFGYDNDIDIGGDAGYFILQRIFHSSGVSFQVFVFVITLFSVFALRQAFRMELWPCFGMVMILGKIFTLYAMSGVRQYIALALCWWGLSELLLKDRRIKFFMIVLLASTIHGSAIIFLPVVFFSHLRFNYKVGIGLLVIAIIIGKLSMTLFGTAVQMSEFVDSRFGGYYEDAQYASGERMNYLNYIENFFFLILALLARNKAVKHVPYYDTFLYMFIVYCGFLIIGNQIGIVKRLRDYYVIAYAFIVPAISYYFSGRRLQKTWRLFIIVYFVFLFFRSLTVYDAPLPSNDYGRMVPYHSIIDLI